MTGFYIMLVVTFATLGLLTDSTWPWYAFWISLVVLAGDAAAEA